MPCRIAIPGSVRRLSPEQQRIGYVLKVYPRFSETFVVNEILAHERAGANLQLFSLRPPVGGRFHPEIGQVRAHVAYVPAAGLEPIDLWGALREEAATGGESTGELAADPDAADTRDAYQALLLAAMVRERGIEHLHAHFASSACVVARLAARLAGVSWSVTAHAKDIFHVEVDPALLATRLADATAVITVSDFNLKHLEAVAPRARVTRVYNGLQLERFPYSAPGGRPAEIVAVGRLVEKKGFGDLVEACARLARDGRDVRCRIVGEGPLEPDLRARISEHGLQENVLLVGPRTQAELRGIVRAAAVLAAPCVVAADGNRDGLPTVLLEALALGTPAVATDVTGIPELIRHGETGLLVSQHDPCGLAAALAQMLDAPALRNRLASAGRALVEREFDVDRNARALREAAWAPGATAVAVAA